MKKPSKDIIVLTIGQALTSTVVSLLTTVSALSGAFLAPALYLSTLPVTATVLGTLLMIYPASSLMGRLGRRGGFMFKAWVGVVGGAISCFSLLIGNFALLIAGTFLLGIFSAFGQYYRFAAIDAAKTPQEHTAAVAIVTSAGVAGGIMGPFLGGHFTYAIDSIPYAGAFIALSCICILLALSQSLLSQQLGQPHTITSQSAEGTEQNRQLGSAFISASLIGAMGFAVMTLTMHAAPLSLQKAGYGMHASAMALQIHFALMYAPSLVIPALIKYIQLKGLVILGVIASTIGCLLTMVPEQTLAIYVLELGLSGIGWNFMFNGGTLLLTKTYDTHIKTKAQGLNSLIVYSANIVASFSVAPLMAFCGWTTVNLVGIPLLMIALLALWHITRLPLTQSSENH